MSARSFPTDRFAALLRAHEARGGTLAELSRRSGVSERALREIREERVACVRFGVADRIVVALDVTLWHRPPPFGFGDLYGSPLVLGPSARPETNLDSEAPRESGRAPRQRPRPDTEEVALDAA
jgi:lambda repressor-like predicted transcriptional regulator